MSKQNELNSYIGRVIDRLRLRAWILGCTVLASTALLTTVTLVLALNHYAFPATGVKGGRLALALTLILVIAFFIVLPLFRVSAGRAVHKAEATHPNLGQRLTTFHEQQHTENDVFLELLAADTLALTEEAPPTSIAPGNRLFAILGIGLGCLCTLIWLIAAKPGFVGYGAALLWTGEQKNAAPLYSINIAPGDATVRRNGDQLITANVVGLRPEKVQIFARYQNAKNWELASMHPQPNLGGAMSYQFVLAGLPESVEYYVTAGPLTSPHYNVRVVDLPSVRKIKVIYQYPKWTGEKPAAQEQTGDLRAIEGTDAQIEVEMDKPLKDGRLTLDDSKTIKLSEENANTYTGTIHMTKDGAYHIAAVDRGQPVRLSEDYFIATDKAEPPQVSITRPSGDYRASPIEEVAIGVQGSDRFGLRDLHLHYSVNGGSDHDVDMLKNRGAKDLSGTHTLPLEDYKLVPGDLVALYATAKDGHSETRTNISFIQIDPFEREFSQSQQSGAGGGGGSNQNNQTDMSKREKELIAATWKQQNDKASGAKEAAAMGQFLSDAQNKLRDQVMALSTRMQSRDLSEANDEFNSFAKDMQQAATAMSPSAEKLKGMQWKDALPSEQKALQALLRAEATFRQIQVTFGQQGGGGGGGANSAGRDLASLFDLELDTEKNQYETAKNTSPAEKQQKEIDDLLAKLDALANRQEELNRQQKNPQQGFQERWQQEMLRREAEQLQREMEQLAQNNQQNSGSPQNGQQSSFPQSGSQQQQSSSANTSGSGQNSGSPQDQRIQQALSRLRQANDAMKRNGTREQSSGNARQAAERLQEAKNLLSASQQQLATGKLGSLSQEANRIMQQERAQNQRIDHFGNQPDTDQNRENIETRLRERNQLAAERQQLSNDLSKLEKDLRDSARRMAPNQPKTAQKLRQALTGMDESDLDNHMQRTADWLRRGVNPNSGGTESEIAHGLQKLSQQLREAQDSMRQEQPGQQTNSSSINQTAALEQLRRMRNQIEAMDGSGNKDLKRQSSAPTLNAADTHHEGTSEGGRGQNQQNPGRGAQNAPYPGQQLESNRLQGGTNNGEIRAGGSRNDGVAWGNINTGNNTYASGAMRPVPTDASGNPQDAEQNYRQQLREVGQLGHIVQGDPNLSKEIQDLTRRMQQLDPKRFPGNPDLVDQMHHEVLSSIDRIELQLANQGSEAEARTGKSSVIPDGYQDSVADYYRRLSKSH